MLSKNIFKMMGPYDTECITGIPLLKQAKPYQSDHLDHVVLIL